MSKNMLISTVKLTDETLFVGEASKMSALEFCNALDKTIIELKFCYSTDCSSDVKERMKKVEKLGFIDGEYWIKDLPHDIPILERFRFIGNGDEFGLLRRSVDWRRSVEYINLLKTVDEETAKSFGVLEQFYERKISKKYKTSVNYSKEAYKARDYEKVLADILKACDEEPFNIKAWVALVWIKYKMKKPVEEEFIKIYKILSLPDVGEDPTCLTGYFSEYFGGFEKVRNFEPLPDAKFARKWLRFDSGIRSYGIHIYAPWVCLFPMLWGFELAFIIIGIIKTIKFSKIRKKYNIGHLKSDKLCYHFFDSYILTREDWKDCVSYGI